jgi:hypothetical protein
MALKKPFRVAVVNAQAVLPVLMRWALGRPTLAAAAHALQARQKVNTAPLAPDAHSTPQPVILQTFLERRFIAGGRGGRVAAAAASGALSVEFWRCKGEAVSAVSDTAFPGPGVASTGLRRVWRHGGSRYLLHLGVAF